MGTENETYKELLNKDVSVKIKAKDKFYFYNGKLLNITETHVYVDDRKEGPILLSLSDVVRINLRREDEN